MQGGFISYGLLAALAIALLYGAYTDLKRRQIDNGLNLAIACAAPLYWWASGLPLADIGWQLGLALLVFVIATALFALRQMGGGDVKLLTALALWIAPAAFLKLFVIMALVGAALSVVSGVFNMRQPAGETLRHRLALLAGGVWVAFTLYALFVIGGGTPVHFSTALGQVVGPRLMPWIFWPVLAVLLAVTVTGTRQIVRRQKKRLPIPYGLAISVAGLWLLAAGQIPLIHAAGLAG